MIKTKKKDPQVWDSEGSFENLELKSALGQFDSSRLYNKLEKNTKGLPYSNHRNVFKVFMEDPRLYELIRKNVFTKEIEITRIPDWRSPSNDCILWSDEDMAQLYFLLGAEYDLTTKTVIEDVFTKIADSNAYHPIKNYLKSLKWDKQKRLERLFIDYLGAEDNEFNRLITKQAFTAAVYRIFEPGYKHDTAIILIGKQGIGKSKILAKMGGKWFNDSIDSFSGDEAYMKIASSWIIELSELTALNSSSIERLKQFLSATIDTFRRKYHIYTVRQKRQCIFFGTTNQIEFLKDDTGNRRLLPMLLDGKRIVKNIDQDLTKEEIGQIWAEAYHYYKKRIKTYIEGPEMLKHLKQLHQRHTIEDGLAGEIERFLHIPIPKDWYELTLKEQQRFIDNKEYKSNTLRNDLVPRDKVCALEIRMVMLKDTNIRSTKLSIEINNILRKLPNLVETTTKFGDFGEQRGFFINIEQE